MNGCLLYDMHLEAGCQRGRFWYPRRFLSEFLLWHFPPFPGDQLSRPGHVLLRQRALAGQLIAACACGSEVLAHLCSCLLCTSAAEAPIEAHNASRAPFTSLSHCPSNCPYCSVRTVVTRQTKQIHRALFISCNRNASTFAQDLLQQSSHRLSC